MMDMSSKRLLSGAHQPLASLQALPCTQWKRAWSPHPGPCRRSATRASDTSISVQGEGAGPRARQALKSELFSLVERMGVMAVLPGSPEDKARVNALVERLKEQAPQPASEGESAWQQLQGDWQLVYALQGTVVTRTGWGTTLIQSGAQLPGIGINLIQQRISTDAEGRLVVLNDAEFGLGPLGTWQVAIEGFWRPVRAGDITHVKIVFQRLKVKPVGVLGRPLPSWLPQVLLPLGQGDEVRSGAEWLTPYLDSDVRVGQGKSGNIFVFKKVPEALNE